MTIDSDDCSRMLTLLEKVANRLGYATDKVSCHAAISQLEIAYNQWVLIREQALGAAFSHMTTEEQDRFIAFLEKTKKSNGADTKGE